MVERCALSGSDLKIKFRTILLTSIQTQEASRWVNCPKIKEEQKPYRTQLYLRKKSNKN